ncbi:fatty acid binding protein [Holotrichia oblita]|uniref:Fatty acid binding protein n=1 Tax=Holotrichia oblita TaxID=644536 RepID=A0ACB9SUQ4_HOLOL|nr:fatty acid binding protein [Holotrichia oblita]
MVQISGKYELQSNENFVAYLKGLGSEVSDELAKTIDALKPVLEVTVDGNNFSLITNVGSSSNFTLGTEFEDEILSGVKVKSVATLNGNVLKIESISSDNRKGLREYTFGETDLVITYSGGASNVVAKRVYARI